MELAPSVKKHVAVIHCSGELSLLERKLNNILLLNAYDDLQTKGEHSIPVAVATQMAGYNSRDSKKLKDALKCLVTTPLEYNLLGDDVGPDWGVSGLLASAEIKRGVITYSYSALLAKLLYNPAIYAHINLAVQRKFESSFALNLYENCVRFRKVKTTGWWSLDVARRLLGATAAIYEDYKRFNNKVLKPAVASVNQCSDIEVELKTKRGAGRGSPVEQICFLIKDNAQRTMFDLSDDNFVQFRSLSGYRALIHVGCSDRLALQAVMQEGNDYALSIAGHVSEKYKAGKIKSSPGALAGYLVSNKIDVAGTSGLEAEVAREKESAKRMSTPAVDDTKAIIEKYRSKFEQFRTSKAFEGLSQEAIRKFAQAMIEEDRQHNGRAAQMWDEQRAIFRGGIYAGKFDSFVTQKILGPYEDQDILVWLASTRAGQGTPTKAKG
ncbi:MAG: RepB family plasmid replication initiator protein [Rhizobium sp.]|nr:MAG: RepB family plasmid replication initiator protein [Rhizobium sp.]